MYVRKKNGLTPAFLPCYHSGMYGGTVSKQVGGHYEVVWDRDAFTVTVLRRGRVGGSFRMGRFCDSLDVYASIRKASDARRACELGYVYLLTVMHRRQGAPSV